MHEKPKPCQGTSAQVRPSANGKHARVWQRCACCTGQPRGASLGKRLLHERPADNRQRAHLHSKECQLPQGTPAHPVIKRIAPEIRISAEISQPQVRTGRHKSEERPNDRGTERLSLSVISEAGDFQGVGAPPVLPTWTCSGNSTPSALESAARRWRSKSGRLWFP
jgi:hypothetical protein